MAAADVGGAGAEDGAVRALRAAGAEFQHRAAFGGADDAVGLGGDQALVVQREQQIRLNELRLNGGRADGQQRLLGEDRRALGHGIDVAGEFEVRKVFEELLAEQLPAAQVGDVIFCEVQALDILHDLLEAGGDGEAALVRHAAEKYVKIRDAVLEAALKITVAHGQLVEVAEHSQVESVFTVHIAPLI